MIKHDKLINTLEQRLQNSKINYSIIDKNVKYSLGEIDLWAINETNGRPNILFFEMKSSYHTKSENKAKDQLQRMYNNFNNKHINIYCFEVYGLKKGYSLKRYRPKQVNEK